MAHAGLDGGSRLFTALVGHDPESVAAGVAVGGVVGNTECDDALPVFRPAW